jgi:hypothetical protein
VLAGTVTLKVTVTVRRAADAWTSDEYPERLKEVSTDLTDVGSHLERALRDFQARHGRTLHLEVEPGTYLVAQAGELEKQPRLRPPLLTGDDLIALGMKPGPALGALLAEIREKQLQDELKTKAQARKWARGRIGKP